jgi:hypothetical protein
MRLCSLQRTEKYIRVLMREQEAREKREGDFDKKREKRLLICISKSLVRGKYEYFD